MSGRAGAGGRAGGRRAGARGAQAGRRQRAARRWRARGRASERAAGRAGVRLGARRARGRQCAAGRDRTRGRARQDARQGVAGGGSARPGRPGRGPGVQLGQVGCFDALDSFFGPVRLGSFLSHQMNTVHCKIFFRKKKNLLNLIKIK